MIKLSDRLNVIAEEIEMGETVADIGTDHGFLPIFLWENRISPKVIMTDISEGSLNKAIENCRRFHPETEFDLRLGSGIDVLSEGETDDLIIAGMGGMLMTEILGKDPYKAKSFKKIVLQPRNNIGRLRHWLYNNGFSVKNEKLVREGRFICEVITAVPVEVAVTRSMGPERIEYEYPHTLIKFQGPLTREYLSTKLRIEKNILSGMMSSSAVSPKELRSQEYRIEYIERLMRKL